MLASVDGNGEKYLSFFVKRDLVSETSFLWKLGKKEKASFFPRWGFQGRSRLNKWIFAEISQKMKISKDIETSKSEN